MNLELLNKTFFCNKKLNSTSSVACLFSITSFYNLNISVDQIKEKLIIGNKGETSLMNIADVAFLYGFITTGYSLERVEEIEQIYTPSIIPVYNDEGRRDFFIFYGKFNNKFLLGDPSWGINLYTLNEFLSIWRDLTVLEFRYNSVING
jgi:ABC-type bacteriocin/lantibiotic exporter with double-glycine peptidase domain